MKPSFSCVQVLESVDINQIFILGQYVSYPGSGSYTWKDRFT